MDACWTYSEFALQFSNGKWLHVFIRNARVAWSLAVEPPISSPDVKQIGAPPILLDWGGVVGESLMDCSALLSKRQNSRFQTIFVNECGLYVYMQNQLILTFIAIVRFDTGSVLLYVDEEE